MLFCEKCGAILVPKKEERKIVLRCSCGFNASRKEKLILKEKVTLEKKDEISIIDKKTEILPKIKEECPKCKHHEAYYWLVQTRAGDEGETRFFKCIKCHNTWRQY